MSNKKKISIISAIVIISFIIMGVVYALFSDRIELTNKLKIGSVKIDDLNLTLKKENGDLEDVIEPADLDTISWTTKNLGTSGVLTRHVLEIYWQEATGIDSSELMFLYPANISRQAVIADFNKIKNGGTSDYGLNTEPISKTVANGSKRYGIKYVFVGDTLNGSDGKDVSKEVNYNLANNDVSDSSVIDENINTDDNSKTEDEISFRLLISPKMSYLFQGKNVSVKVTTEAMQYTESGSGNWTVVDTIEIN